MAKIDQLKEFIGFLKALFLTLVAIDSSLIAWLFNHSSLTLKSSLVIFVIAIVSMTVIIMFKYILRKISELEDIE